MTSETFFENFGHLADAPNGVEKLRELVLQMAVRGQLIKQKLSDEPASIMVERAKKIRNELAKNQGFRVPKNIQPLNVELVSLKLPAGWSLNKIGEFALVKGGKRIPKGFTYSHAPTNHIYIRVSDMKYGTITDTDLKYISEDVHHKIKKYTIDKYDLYVTIAGTIGQVGEVPEKFHKMNLTENAAKLVFRLINKSYLRIALESDIVQSQFQEKTNQMAQPKLALKRIANSHLPLPPLEEQKRIVAKVDELMKHCDRLEAAKASKAQVHAKLTGASLNALTSAENPQASRKSWRRVQDNFAQLFDTPGSVQDLRQTILQLAVQGKLVPQDPDDETELLPLDSLLRENSRNGLSHKPSDEPPGIPILRISAATSRADAKVDEEDIKYLEVNDAEIDKYKLEPKDLLACRFNGNLHYVGRFALFEGESKNIRVYPDKLIRFRVDADKVLPEYVVLSMNSPQGRYKIEKFCATTAGNIGISATNLKTVDLRVPPLNEQKRIVAKVDSLMALCDALETKLARKGVDAERLASAVVQHMQAA